LNTIREQLRKQARRVAIGQAADVPSPCMSVCRMDMDTGLCEGCLRTLDEIAAWGRMDDEGKRAVWADLVARLDDEESRT
jgi:predicted Fe-S protein YdhL (DUF1289 family)